MKQIEDIESRNPILGQLLQGITRIDIEIYGTKKVLAIRQVLSETFKIVVKEYGQTGTA